MHKDSIHRNRRQFMAQAIAAALMASVNRHLAWAMPQSDNPTMPGEPTSHRIQRLVLETAASLRQMKEFYRGTLGLSILDERPDRLTIAGGVTSITFVKTKADGGNPFYHFAFNIPENKILSAREWQQKRTTVLPLFPALRDPKFPDDVIHFRSWNAHSIYFFDPAGNILEYIARHDLKNSAAGPFTSKDILYASEIGFVADDVPEMASQIGQSFGLTPYRQGTDAFTAVGDEHGLLLVFKRGRNMSPGLEKPTLADVFPTHADIRAGGVAKFEPSSFPYEINAS